jgi:DNA-binding FadR family transcriptional regulator
MEHRRPRLCRNEGDTVHTINKRMEHLIKPIKPQRVSDQVFEQLRDLIFRGQLRSGAKLLPERELALALRVSRPTLREAINKLVHLGLVVHRQGQGTFVGPPAGQQDKNPLAALRLHDPEAAFTAMKQHITFVLDFIRSPA